MSLNRHTGGRSLIRCLGCVSYTRVWLQMAVGCSVPERHADRQVHVQYSADFGVTWKYLVPQCLPADPRCGGQVSQPSVFFPAEGWKRVVYPLPDSLSDT